MPQFSTNLFINTSAWEMSDLRRFGKVQTSTDSKLSIAYDWNPLTGASLRHGWLELHVTGGGLATLNAAGVPTGGVVNSVMLAWGGGGVLEIQGLNLDARTVVQTLLQDDATEINALLFAGNDVIHGANYNGYPFAISGGDRIDAGSGNDTIYGHGGADVISGGAGDDFIATADGNTPAWGASSAEVYGGEGVDTVSYAEAPQGVVAYLNGALGGTDLLNGVERLIGSPGGDTVVGSHLADTIHGGGGQDFLAGGAGDDVFWIHDGPAPSFASVRVEGGSGYDRVAYGEGVSGVLVRLDGAGSEGDVLTDVEFLAGSRGGDTIIGGAGAETIRGGGGVDTLMGGDGDDRLEANNGSGRLWGEGGDDYIVGGSGFDDIHGNMGDDVAYGGGGDDWVVGGKDQDELYGEAGFDIVYGNLGGDTCDGGAGADWVRGGQGDDIVRGGAGDDWLWGDRGSDTLTGGSGADLFHTFTGAGADHVTDFNAIDGDRVKVETPGPYSIVQVGADTVIDLGAGDRLVLVGVNAATLPAGWIL